MTKELVIHPSEQLADGSIHFEDIPINQYQADIDSAVADIGLDGLLDMFYWMSLIRETELAIDALKKVGRYRDVIYKHEGPAHLSVGQEATAVGVAFDLSVDDHSFGSHRSHGEILAKGLAAIRTADEDWLLDVMKRFRNGEILKIIEGHVETLSVKALSESFLVYGFLSEVFAKATGFNRGLGGSMHAFFPPFGVYPNNAIVGASGSIAPGAALFKKVNRRKGIVVANIGDASVSCGPVWEGMMFSAMEQFNSLWEVQYKGGLPVLFNFIDNFYGMGGQTLGETLGMKWLARVGAGVNASQMHAERVNGFNPLAVRDAVVRKRADLLAGQGPTLLDIVTYRFSGHSSSDASSYRSREEIEEWRQVDPIRGFKDQLLSANVAELDVVEQLEIKAQETVYQALRLATDNEVSPRYSPSVERVGELMFSQGRKDALTEGPAILSQASRDNSRIIDISNKSRSMIAGGLDEERSNFNIRDGIYEAIVHRAEADPSLVIFGEENRDWGGAFGVYKGLSELLPYHRLFNAPIAEAAIVGAAIGYAMEGGRALVEIMYADFVGRAGDEILNQLSKWQAMSGGELEMPVVIRVSVGSRYGAQHSQDVTGLIAQIPGVKVAYPVTPYDAKGIMNAALIGTDPVIVFESQKLYDMGERFVSGGVPEGYFEVGIGDTVLRRAGNDLSLIAVGPAMYTALDAADELELSYGLSADVIDLRSLVPIDYSLIIESVRRTGRAVLVTEATERGSFMQTVASRIMLYCFEYLDAPPVVIGSPNWVTPAPEVVDQYYPTVERIIDTIANYVTNLTDHRGDIEVTRGRLGSWDAQGI